MIKLRKSALAATLLLVAGLVSAGTASAATVHGSEAVTAHAFPGFTPVAHPYRVAMPGRAPNAPLSSAGDQLVNKNSGKCLEVYHSQTGNLANVDQYTCNSTNTQGWLFYYTGTWQVDSVYEIVNDNSGKCMEVYHSQTNNGANVDQYTCNGTATQQWAWHHPSSMNGAGLFINMNSGLALEVAHSSTANLANVDQYIINYTATQDWYRSILT
jgi:hypothetical protein